MGRVLAIGDIHGCSRAFDRLLESVAPGADDQLIALGDYVDRGPDSAGVLERLIRLYQAGELIALRGNHEIMLLDAYDGGRWTPTWRSCGGEETLMSYGEEPGEPAPIEHIPKDHLKFLEDDLLPFYETETHIFVHAFAEPGLPMEEQTEASLYWRKYIDPQPHQSGKTWVCGHSAQRNGLPAVRNGSICIDTYSYGEGGWLTCLDALSGQCWQANEAGDTRQFVLGDGPPD